MASSLIGARRHAGVPGSAVHEMARQLRDVDPALGQGRHHQRHDVQPVEEVLAELAGAISALRSRLVEAITRTSTSTRVSPPRRAEALLLQDPQDLALRSRSGMSATWSISRVPPSARSSRPIDARLVRPRHPASAPNSSMSTRSGASAAALRMTNGAPARRDCGVDQPRRHLLAGAGRAADQTREPVGATRSIAWRTRMIGRRRCRSARSRRRPGAELGDLAAQAGWPPARARSPAAAGRT